MMENPIKMDDLGVPLFLETPISYIVIFLLVVIPQVKSVNQKYGQPWII